MAQCYRPVDQENKRPVPATETIMMGMKAPGAGVLEFEVEPTGRGLTRITATAYWYPAGLWGLLYRYSLVPAHLVIFKGMTRAIARRAEPI